MANILLASEDAKTEDLSNLLIREGNQVKVSKSSRAALLAYSKENPDLVIWDLALPGKDGVEGLKAIRKRDQSIPLIAISKKKDDESAIAALDAGADDFITTPYSLNVVTALIRAQIRKAEKNGHIHSHGKRGSGSEPNQMKIGPSTVHLEKMVIRRGTKEYPISPKEAGILKVLYQNRGKVVNREMVMKEIWGTDKFVTERVIDTNVVAIRKKLGDGGRRAKYIKTVFGVGYKLLD